MPGRCAVIYRVYLLETGEVIATITGDSNAECEAIFSRFYDTNDYAGTYCEHNQDGSKLVLGSIIPLGGVL